MHQRKLALRLGLLLSGIAVAHAQSPDEEPPVLHEFVKIEPSGVAKGKAFLPGENGDLPRGIVYKDEVLPQPSISAEAKAQPNMIPDDDTVVPDANTEKEGLLSYEEIFNPAIAPFKRTRSFELVKSDETLGIADPTLKPIPVIGNVTDPERDLFYGALDLVLTAGQSQPLPSVSPESRILSYKTSPKVSLSFFKDSADNFYVTSDTSISTRLIFVTDAPKDYFSGDIPEAVTLADIPANLVPTIPTATALKAREVRKAAKIPEKSKRYQELLPPLISYFRAFEARTFVPDPSGDLYLALSLSKQGVCRHRAYAFTITAQSIGIPSRYVFNEAHAWVEVYIPELGWRRIDLGGASAGLDVSNARGKPVYEPEKPDPFDKPESYQESYSNTDPGSMDGASGFAKVTGLRKDQDGGSSGGAPSEDGGPTQNDPSLPPTNDAGSSAPPSTPPPPLVVGTTPVTLSVQKSSQEVFRGQTIDVQGQALGPSGPAAKVRVEIFLEKDGEKTRLGAAATDEQGAFQGKFLIPAELSPLGVYRIIVSTPGDSTYAPSGSP